jgi:hypothetical protein
MLRKKKKKKEIRLLGSNETQSIERRRTEDAATFTPWCETVFSHHGCGSI